MISLCLGVLCVFARVFPCARALCGEFERVVWIDHEFLRDTRVEILATLRCRIQRDHLDIDCLGNLDAFMQDRHHQAAVILHHRGLTREKRVRLGPIESETQTERALPCSIVFRARVFGYIEPRYAYRARDTRDFHQLVEYYGRLIGAAVPLGFETDAIHRAIHFRNTEDLLDPFGDTAAFPEIEGFATERARMRATRLV